MSVLTVCDGAAWLAPIERLLVHAAREIQPLAALTPVEACGERHRLIEDLRAGRRPRPRWTYPLASLDELTRALDAAERELAPVNEPLPRLYLGRVRELLLEAALCGAAGTRKLGTLARQRYEADPFTARAASELCDRYLAEAETAAAGELVASDAPDPRSLLSRMRDAVGQSRLPFAVVARPALAALAATGDRVIYVAAGRVVSEEDAVRTVVHEVEGHARPRARAAAAPIVLFRVGSARGTDDQEGRALVLEERAGLFSARRRRQLAARHRAVEAMLDGATFGEVASSLVVSHGLDAADAIVASERVFRGSDGERAGLGRERVYLEAFLRVRAHLRDQPEDERVLEAGQVALDAVDTLRRWVS